MISRVQVQAFGPSIEAVAEELRAFAGRLGGLNGHAEEPMMGQQVVERDLGEPEGCDWAYKGRLLLHPNVANALSDSA
jgi:hypothetical protein